MNTVKDITMHRIFDSLEYKAVKEFYGKRTAHRSKVPLIKHINQGLIVMEAISASYHAMQAYCLHPLFQAELDFRATVHRQGPFWMYSPHAILLVMEYRYRANAWLSDKIQRVKIDPEDPHITADGLQVTGLPDPGSLSEVRDMLIADKVQNYRDFLKHHSTTHERALELGTYFRMWLQRLDVDVAETSRLFSLIAEQEKP